IPIMQAFSREEINDRRFAASVQETLSATLSLTAIQIRFKVFIGLATALGTAGILWLGASQPLAGAISLRRIIAFPSCLGSCSALLEAVMYTISTIQGAAGSARRVLEILRTEREVADRPGARPIPAVRGRVEFERVTFGYESGRPILRDVSLHVEPA